MSPLKAELSTVMELQALLIDPRRRVSSQARAELDEHIGKVVAYLTKEARTVWEGKKTTDEALALARDVGEFWYASGSLRAWGILGAIAGVPHIDKKVVEEAERYALDGYVKRPAGNS